MLFKNRNFDQRFRRRNDTNNYHNNNNNNNNNNRSNSNNPINSRFQRNNNNNNNNNQPWRRDNRNRRQLGNRQRPNNRYQSNNNDRRLDNRQNSTEKWFKITVPHAARLEQNYVIQQLEQNGIQMVPYNYSINNHAIEFYVQGDELGKLIKFILFFVSNSIFLLIIIFNYSKISTFN